MSTQQGRAIAQLESGFEALNQLKVSVFITEIECKCLSVHVCTFGGEEPWLLSVSQREACLQKAFRTTDSSVEGRSWGFPHKAVK